MQAAKVGVVGCGSISGIYFRAGQRFEAIEITACADLDRGRAEARAREFGVPRVCTTEELLADPEIQVVMNLTVPGAHAEVSLAAIEAGKSVYSEKPLAVTREEGRRILDAARAKGVRVGCAPDTFLGAGGQTCRRLIDDGAIGRPVAAVAFMAGHGHESWHPSPEFYYKPGGGPMLDMGVYYLTALVNLLGPVRRATGATGMAFPERTITSEPKRGTTIRVEVATHVAGLMDFECGAIGTTITSFDVWAANLPLVQVYGTDGSLSVPDPNGFGGPVRLWRVDAREWREVPLTHPYAQNSRGLGAADMIAALRSGRPHRASAELAFHVLDLMCAFHDASDGGAHVELESTCERPAPVPADLPEGRVDP
jgi:predicted dehydrogenase